MSNADKRRQLSQELCDVRTREESIRKSFPKERACCAPDCFEDADWVRSTQFSGDHPYCDAHAKQEDDFGESDPSYFHWHTIAEFLEVLELRKKD